MKNYLLDNWDIIKKATYYKNKSLIFTFPWVYKKFWDLKQIKQIKKFIY